MLNQVTIRRSRLSDMEEIRNLIMRCFGFEYDCLENLENRYLCACINDIPIGISGINKNNEVDWSCVLPEYQRKGIMSNLLSCLLKESKGTIYWNAWRIPALSSKANADKLLQNFGFKLVEPCREKYNCDIKSCTYRSICGLECYVDRYSIIIK